MRTRPALPAPRPPRPLYRPASKRLYYKCAPPPSSVDLVCMARRRINRSCLLDSVNTSRAWRRKMRSFRWSERHKSTAERQQDETFICLY
ncbi:hypothetical protein CDAR_390401 [Caerostris darwini]|uniref:Uncharacterized protein n=1 Tax=Caerostris darwini TaxID=1538125 RepID=A0AAV4NYZ0_9ARAC|nr:hypothetical protein CDAR_390401 [Caerostris darwini]